MACESVGSAERFSVENPWDIHKICMGECLYLYEFGNMRAMTLKCTPMKDVMTQIKLMLSKLKSKLFKLGSQSFKSFLQTKKSAENLVCRKTIIPPIESAES